MLIKLQELLVRDQAEFGRDEPQPEIELQLLNLGEDASHYVPT